MTDDKPGLIEGGLKLAGQVTHGLGPQFLALILVNILFLAALFWFVDGRARHTAALINQLLATCLQQLHGTP